MKIIIQQATIVDANAKHHLKKRDILIEGGIIQKIAANISIPKSTKVISAKSIKISPGWVETAADFCDPGCEHKEDLTSGPNAAAAGGFTHVMVLPTTTTVLQNKGAIEYVLNKTQQHIVTVLPAGALTENLNSNKPTEIYDMYNAGAVAFTNGAEHTVNTENLIRSLNYVKPFNGVVFVSPTGANNIYAKGLNEGIASLMLGLKGQPAIIEEINIIKYLIALQYSNSKLHLMQLSSKAALAHLKKAKKSELSITAAVSPYHLIFTEEKLQGFDTDFKLTPPLRTQNDCKVLIKALIDGTIDMISCLHQPQDEDLKKVEFENAACGINGLQTVYSLLKTYLNDNLTDELLVEKLATQPRKLLNLPNAVIEEGNKASITMFNNEDWTFTKANNKSKSSNSPFIGKTLKGKVIGIINNNQLYLN